MLGIWMLGGILALCGALCYAELAAMFPYTGGSYAFLREAYGRFPAFAYGWSALLVTYPASVAAVAMVFTAYLSRLVPVAEPVRPFLAASLCLALTGLNILGVRLGAWTLRVFTSAKVIALSAIVLLAFLAGHGSWGHLTSASGVGSGITPGAVALALVAVIWTYEGWTDGPTLSGEVRNPNRDLVAALLLGTTGVMLIYLLINIAYVFVLGIEGVRSTDSVAVDVATVVLGRGGNLFVTVLVLVSTLGSMMGMIIAASRVFFALGQDKLFFDWAGRIHRRGSPAGALAGIGVMSALYTVVGTFEIIIGYFVFVATIFLTFNVGSVIWHRRRQPERRRPFRVPLYPLPPLVFLVVASGLMIQLLRENSGNALVGLGIVLASIPVYLAWEQIRNRSRGSGGA
jgi:APA family basic amino acid/polyamine antiporter